MSIIIQKFVAACRLFCIRRGTTMPKCKACNLVLHLHERQEGTREQALKADGAKSAKWHHGQHGQLLPAMCLPCAWRRLAIATRKSAKRAWDTKCKRAKTKEHKVQSARSLAANGATRIGDGR